MSEHGEPTGPEKKRVLKVPIGDMIEGLSAELEEMKATNAEMKEQLAKAEAKNAHDPAEPEGKEWFEFKTG
jgi:type II secretory pathway component PulM